MMEKAQGRKETKEFTAGILIKAGILPTLLNILQYIEKNPQTKKLCSPKCQ